MITMSIFRAGIVLLCLTAAAAAQNPPLPAPPSTGGVATVGAGEAKELTAPQRAAILQAVKHDDRKITVPSGIAPTVGAELPPSLELYMLPDTVLAEIPAAKQYKYTRIQDKVVLVDPTNMRIVDVLSE